MIGAGDSRARKSAGETEPPKLRHEFVGMMFAVAVGEVGLQVAALMRHENSIHHYLPAYAQLLLATVVIAASWVGWSLSRAARPDVTGVLEVGFVVLLTDVILVICYFVLARSVESQILISNGQERFAPTAVSAANCMLVIFCLYLFWDLWTKVVVYVSRKCWGHEQYHKWWPNYFVRFIPTVICLLLAFWVWQGIDGSFDPSQVVIGDAALLLLALLFRAGKGLVSAIWPMGDASTGWQILWPFVWTVTLALAFAYAVRRMHAPVARLDSFIKPR
jgi:hypothetical protein